MSAAKALRARHLAERYPAVQQSMIFVAQVHQASPNDLASLNELLRRIAPSPLCDVIATQADIDAYWHHPDPSHPASLHARILLEAALPGGRGADGDCPRCGHPPQLGVLRPMGDGNALTLACSLCRTEWPASRRVCPVCAKETIEFYSTDAYPHIATQVCTACETYLHIIDLSKDPQAILEVDEIAAQPLDLWALDQGYNKIYPNWVGL